MPFVPAPGVVEVTAIGTCSGEPCVNVWDVRVVSGTVTEDDMDNIAAVFDFWYANSIAPIVHSTWTHTLTRCRNLTVQDGLVKEYSINTNGALSGSPLPSQNTVCVSLRSNLAGRSRRGRKYFSGGRYEDLVGADVNLWSTAMLDDMRDAVDLLRTTLFGDFALCVVSRMALGVWRTTALVSDVTAVTIATSRVTTQRGRLT